MEEFLDAAEIQVRSLQGSDSSQLVMDTMAAGKEETDANVLENKYAVIWHHATLSTGARLVVPSSSPGPACPRPGQNELRALTHMCEYTQTQYT